MLVAGATCNDCWTKTHTAPVFELSAGPPKMAVLPSTDRATELPCSKAPTAPVPVSLPPSWVQTPPLLAKTQAAPRPPLSLGPPEMAVLPSADRATETPCSAFPTAPVPTNLLPCWVQVPPLLVKTQAAPVFELSPSPPKMAVLPSPDSATEMPCWAIPTAPVPTSLLPYWVQMPPLLVKIHA